MILPDQKGNTLVVLSERNRSVGASNKKVDSRWESCNKTTNRTKKNHAIDLKLRIRCKKEDCVFERKDIVMEECFEGLVSLMRFSWFLVEDAFPMCFRSTIRRPSN